MKKFKKAAAAFIAAVMTVSAMTAMSAGVSADWIKFKDGSYGYRDSRTNKQLTGWQTIDGGRYYFDKSGKALTGKYKIGGKNYYFDPAEKGKALTSWAKIGGNYYYFGKNGTMKTGWTEIDGKIYYFGKNGAMLSGKYKIDGTVYEFGTDGVLRISGADYDPFAGLTLRMSMDEVIKALELEPEDYEIDGDYLTVYDKECCFVFDNDSLFAVSIVTEYSAPDTAGYKGYFTENGWLDTSDRIKTYPRSEDEYESEDEPYGFYSYGIERSESTGMLTYDPDMILFVVVYDIK